MLLIKNALVFCENGFERGDIAIDGGLFAEIRAAGDGIPGAPPDCEIIDAEGCYAIPGLIDIHFHGCMGCDFSSASVGEMSMMARYQARNGVTAICPATMTLPEDALALACGRMAELAARQRGGSQGGAGFGERAGKTGAGGAGAGKIGTVAGGTRASGAGEAVAGASDAGGATAGASGAYYAGAAGARPIEDAESALIGINLEGPFISAEKLGAQNPAYVRPPSLPMFDRLQAASGGLIKLLAIAPETEGAMGMISALRDRVTVSLAHTAAGYSLSKEAFAAGARHVTHLYNAMLPFAHREPGLPGAAFDTPGVMAELICDGVHVHPAAARATFRLLGDSRVALVSDSMMATGLSDGMYELGGLPVRVSGNRAVLASGGGIAGSVTNLMDCLRVAVRDMGIPLHSAVKCASANPARTIGAYGGDAGVAAGRVCGEDGGAGGVASGNACGENGGVVGAAASGGRAGGGRAGGGAYSGNGCAAAGSEPLFAGGVAGRGAIMPGMVADLVLLGADLAVRQVFLRGKRLLGGSVGGNGAACGNDACGNDGYGNDGHGNDGSNGSDGGDCADGNGAACGSASANDNDGDSARAGNARAIGSDGGGNGAA